MASIDRISGGGRVAARIQHVRGQCDLLHPPDLAVTAWQGARVGPPHGAGHLGAVDDAGYQRKIGAVSVSQPTSPGVSASVRASLTSAEESR